MPMQIACVQANISSSTSAIKIARCLSLIFADNTKASCSVTGSAGRHIKALHYSNKMNGTKNARIARARALALSMNACSPLFLRVAALAHPYSRMCECEPSECAPPTEMSAVVARLNRPNRPRPVYHKFEKCAHFKHCIEVCVLCERYSTIVSHKIQLKCSTVNRLNSFPRVCSLSLV